LILWAVHLYSNDPSYHQPIFPRLSEHQPLFRGNFGCTKRSFGMRNFADIDVAFPVCLN
jgi:hypothetical protein